MAIIIAAFVVTGGAVGVAISLSAPTKHPGPATHVPARARPTAAAPGTAAGPPVSASPARTVFMTCPTTALDGATPVAVYLPPGYRTSSLRYPVVYFLHGLPASPITYRQNQFVAHAIDQIGRKAIVVAPRGARTNNEDREYLDWAPHENWPAAIGVQIPQCIDAAFRTIANRRGRALIGLSAGGFGAFNIGFRHFAQFAAVESWSGYFAATSPSGRHVLQLGSPAADRDASVPDGVELKRSLRRYPTFIGFYVGRQDTLFLPWNVALNRALTRQGIPHVFSIYSGGHTIQLWTTHSNRWLGMLLAHLSDVRAG